MDELQAIESLHLDGTETMSGMRPRPRYLIQVNGKDYWLPCMQFRTLVLLATAEWRTHEELTAGDNASRNIYRLKVTWFAGEFGYELPIKSQPGEYGLGVKATIDREIIGRFPDADIRELASKVGTA